MRNSSELPSGVPGSEIASEQSVVREKLVEHCLGSQFFAVVIPNSLLSSDVSDRAKSIAAQLSAALGNRVGHGEQLIGMFVQQQMVIAEMRTTHVPVKVLGLDVNGEDVGEEALQLGTNLSQPFVGEFKPVLGLAEL